MTLSPTRDCRAAALETGTKRMKTCWYGRAQKTSPGCPSLDWQKSTAAVADLYQTLCEQFKEVHAVCCAVVVMAVRFEVVWYEGESSKVGNQKVKQGRTLKL